MPMLGVPKYEGDWFSRLHCCLFFEEAGLEDNAAAVNLAVNLLRISVQSIMLFCRDVLQDSLEELPAFRN